MVPRPPTQARLPNRGTGLPPASWQVARSGRREAALFVRLPTESVVSLICELSSDVPGRTYRFRLPKLRAMWNEPVTAWKIWSPRFLGDEIDPDRATSPWAGHRDFVYDLVRWRQPTVTVELGTHFGCSFFALVQALADAQSQGSIHAVDTWKGDPHAGEYGDDVFETFSTNLGRLEERTADRQIKVEIHQKTFAEALPEFEPDSIDLLHIDGCHTYEALERGLRELAAQGGPERNCPTSRYCS